MFVEKDVSQNKVSAGFYVAELSTTVYKLIFYKKSAV